MNELAIVSLLASIMLVVIALLMYIRGELQLGIRLFYREEKTVNSLERVLDDLTKTLRARGYRVEGRNHELVIKTGLVDIPVRPMTIGEKGYIISWWMEPTTASIILFVAGLALYLIPAVIVAVLAYMKYDEVSSIIRANIQ